MEHVRAGVNLGGTVEEKPVQDIVPRVVSICRTKIFGKLATVGTK